MKLIENSGWVALVEIDGVEWHMATEVVRQESGQNDTSHIEAQI